MKKLIVTVFFLTLFLPLISLAAPTDIIYVVYDHSNGVCQVVSAAGELKTGWQKQAGRWFYINGCANKDGINCCEDICQSYSQATYICELKERINQSLDTMLKESTDRLLSYVIYTLIILFVIVVTYFIMGVVSIIYFVIRG